MELKTYFAQDVEGNVVPGAQVSVYQAGTMSLATGLKDAAGNALSNPFNGGADGSVQFAAPDGDYDVRVTSGARQYTIRARFIDAAQQLVLINQLAEDAASDALLAQQSRDQAVAAATAAENALAEFGPELYVPRAGGVAMAGPLSVPAGASGAQVPQAQEVALLASTPLGFRSKVINGNFSINQDGVSGTVTLTAGQYGHDQWKAGASGCTYTFAKSGGVTTLTISAGSLVQPIEGDMLSGGTHVLSWTGTAQGKIGAGSYGASGVTATLTAGADTSIEFGTGTVSLVQLEQGERPTPFERRLDAIEMLMCMRYYERTYDHGELIGNSNDLGTDFSWRGASTTSRMTMMKWRVAKRVVPTVFVINPATGATNSVRNRSVGTNLAVTPGTPTREWSPQLSAAYDGAAVYSVHLIANARM